MSNATKSALLTQVLNKIKEVQTWEIELTEELLMTVGQTSTIEKIVPAIIEKDGKLFLMLHRRFDIDTEQAVLETESEIDGQAIAQEINDAYNRLAKKLSDSHKPLSRQKVQQKIEDFYSRANHHDLGESAVELIHNVAKIMNEAGGEITPELKNKSINTIIKAQESAKATLSLGTELIPHMEDITLILTKWQAVSSDQERIHRLIASILKNRCIIPETKEYPLQETEFTVTDAKRLGQQLRDKIIQFYSAENQGLTKPQSEIESEFEDKEESEEGKE